MRGIGSVALLGALCALTSTASAQAGDHEATEQVTADPPEDLDPAQLEGRALFDAAQIAFSDGRYEEALDLFTRSHARSGHAELLYNIGLCHERLGQDAEAIAAYRRYLGSAETPRHRAELERRIGVMEARLADPDPVDASSGPSPAPWIVLGLGGATAIVGAVLLGLASAAADRVSDARGVDWRTVSGDYDDSVTFSTAGGILLAVGGAAVAAGLIWGIADASGSGETEVAVGPGSVALRRAF